ncbi:probable mixed-linked glucan synthase 3 [Phragmites australis]|uniref:probable mixed-linked glucan synthase 3 n=1 Tax=Phragmites australis TaxID=29695 RepID=UPI002D799309|nr:probable mixed-linked glucan synthase 3 [Phragmites australis]
MSSLVPGAGGAAREDDAGLNEPLLANGDRGFHTGGALAAVVVANAHGSGGAKEKGAVKVSKDRYWEDVHQPDAVAAADLESGGGRPLLFSNKKVKATLLYPYRTLVLIRLVAVILFIAWRIKNNNSDVMWFWVTSVVGDVWFAFSWLLYQLPKFSPIKRTPDLATLRQHYDLPDGGSILPGIDVFVTTADPVNEPVLYTMNCVLSILAADYPVDRYTCYLSDDSGALILYEALVEAASFASMWVPFCRKHSIEPRAPESYFQMEGMIYNGRSPGEFMNDYRHVQREYEELKVRLETLPSTIQERSDVCNSMKAKEGGAKATWMANGTQWPGTWIEPTENHRKGHHAGIVKIVQNHPSRCKPQQGFQGSNANPDPVNFGGVDARLPMLVYVSREKSPCSEHNKKAGNLNAQLRISGLLSNAPFVINFDCDHYVNNSQALRAAMCLMLDSREGGSTGFVQFPQRFENVDPTDRYGNHNRVFFDGAMYALNGLQGPTYLGTGCMFRRLALYGLDPPRWRPEDITVDSNKFGNSIQFLNSVLVALKQERRITPPELDEPFLAEMAMVVSSSYDQGTDWGSGVGYIYNIATEDIVTGYRIHGQGWRSMYCTMERDAFHGTAPINLTERLYQIVRWSGGSLEVFFSPYNPLFSGRRLHLMQRAAYLNFTIYPITSIFIILYAFCPVMWLIPEEILIQRPFTRYVVYLIVVIALIHAIGIFEIRWAGVTWMDWWRNEQFFMIASMSAYPTALLHMVVKPLTGKGIQFRVTSKQAAAADVDDKFAEMYEMRWVPMLIPPAVVLFSNIMAIGVAMGKAVVYNGVWSVVQKRHAALGLLFNVWIMMLLYPFGLAVIGRWSKKSGILFVLFLVAFVVIGLVYIGVHAFLVNFLPFMVI